MAMVRTQCCAILSRRAKELIVCHVVENRSTTGERTAPNQEGAYTNAAAISQTLSVDSPRPNSNDELQAREVNIDMQEGLQTTEVH